jgi:hypothetical protein
MSASQRLSCGLISPIIVAAAAALSGCSDTTVADHAACKAKAYEVFKVSPEKSDAYDDVDVKFKQCVTVIKSAADLQTCRDARNKALAVPDALDYVRLCMNSAGYRETDICIEEQLDVNAPTRLEFNRKAKWHRILGQSSSSLEQPAVPSQAHTEIDREALLFSPVRLSQART